MDPVVSWSPILILAVQVPSHFLSNSCSGPGVICSCANVAQRVRAKRARTEAMTGNRLRWNLPWNKLCFITLLLFLLFGVSFNHNLHKLQLKMVDILKL